jgi:hypothetical protein
MTTVAGTYRYRCCSIYQYPRIKSILLLATVMTSRYIQYRFCIHCSVSRFFCHAITVLSAERKANPCNPASFGLYYCASIVPLATLLPQHTRVFHIGRTRLFAFMLFVAVVLVFMIVHINRWPLIGLHIQKDNGELIGDISNVGR